MTENRGPQLEGVCSAIFAIAILTTGARIYVRTRMIKAFGQDDWWMLFATVMYVWYYSMVVSGIGYGTGQHMYNLEPENASRAMHYWYFCYLGYAMTMMGTKLSIGIFLLRITVLRIHRWIIIIVMGLTVITGLVFFFVCLLQCNPVSFFWTQVLDPTTGTCLNVEIVMALLYLYSAVSAVCDFTFGLLPVALIWNLKMDRKTKIAIIPIISIACIASSAVVVRMAFVKDFKTNDFLYKTVDIAIWSTVEMGLAMTAGSLACLRPLFKLISTRFGFSDTSNGNSDGPSRAYTPGGFAPSDDRLGGISKKKKGGMWGSLLTPTNHTSSADTVGIDEEYKLGNVRPLKLGDRESVTVLPHRLDSKSHLGVEEVDLERERSRERERARARDQKMGGIEVTKETTWSVVREKKSDRQKGDGESEDSLNASLEGRERGMGVQWRPL